MIIADVNEFHPLVDGKAYSLGHAPDGSPFIAVILRATYSNTHVDNAYASSLAQARNAGLITGHYGYMTANVDAAAQGTFFGQTVKSHGGLRPGDSIWCDAEEGTGNQSQRIRAFLLAAHAVLQDPIKDEGEYSGSSFFTTHIGSRVSVDGVTTHLWIAAYQRTEPAQGEDLWQNTDAFNFPGISGPADASIFNGTPKQYLALFIGGPVPNLARPICCIIVRPQGDGYWLIGQDGGIFPFGACAPITQAWGTNPVVKANLQPGHLVEDAEVWPDGNGLVMVGEDGGTFAFGSAKDFGNITSAVSPSPNLIQ